MNWLIVLCVLSISSIQLILSQKNTTIIEQQSTKNITTESKNITNISANSASAFSNITIVLKQNQEQPANATKFNIPIKKETKKPPTPTAYRGPKIYLVPAVRPKAPEYGNQLLSKHFRINPYSTHSELLAAQNVQNYPYNDANQYVSTDYLNQIQDDNSQLLINAYSQNDLQPKYYNPYTPFLYPYNNPFYPTDAQTPGYPPYYLPPSFYPPAPQPNSDATPKSKPTIGSLVTMENATVTAESIEKLPSETQNDTVTSNISTTSSTSSTTQQLTIAEVSNKGSSEINKSIEIPKSDDLENNSGSIEMWDFSKEDSSSSNSVEESSNFNYRAHKISQHSDYRYLEGPDLDINNF